MTTGYAPALPFSELQRWALDAEEKGAWTPHRQRAMPLSEFPDSHLERIRAAVESPAKPPKWLDLGLAQIRNRAWYEWHWQRGVDPDSLRTPIPAHIRSAVIARDGYVCQLCGGNVERGDLHLDHIKPWSKGGDHSLANLQVAHSLCNIRKGATWDEPEEGSE